MDQRAKRRITKYQTPDEDDPESVTQIHRKESSYVVNEVIMALMRKGILSEQEGKIMLQKLVH